MNRIAALCLSFINSFIIIVVVVEGGHNSTIDWLIKYKFIQFNDEDNTYNIKLSNDIDQRIIDGVKKFQLSAGFPVTGYLDEIQINATRGPLCLSTGDVSDNGAMKRISVWQKNNLTWKYFHPYRSTNLPPSQLIESIIQRAFDVWTQATPLSFRKESGVNKADVNVHFYYHEHSRQSPRCKTWKFDGPGGVLGHGFYPEVGELHLDLSEYWGIFRERELAGGYTDLFSVIYHEIGHVLGLQHSPFILNTGMKSSYTEPQENWRYYKPNHHDVRAIKRLYPGDNRKPSINPWDVTTTAITRDELREGKTRSWLPYERQRQTMPSTRPTVRFFDSAMSIGGEIIVTKNDDLWRFDHHGILHGYPIKLDRFFSGYSVPKVVDTIYQRSVDNYIVIFSNDLYYRYNGNRLVRGYPKRIVDLLGVNERIVDVKTMASARWLVYYFGESRVFLFDEHADRVIYTLNFVDKPTSIVSDKKNIAYVDFVNERNLNVGSGVTPATTILSSIFIPLLSIHLVNNLV